MHIFISYAHVDEYRVRELVDILRDAGHEPWFDHRLVVARSWEDQLLEAIEQCDRFLYALTPESVESAWCQWEFAQAVHTGKPVVPVLIQAGTPLTDALGRIQYADFSKGPDARSTARLLGGIAQAQIIDPADVPLLPSPNAEPERPLEQEESADSSLTAHLYSDAYVSFRAKEYAEAFELLNDCLLLDAHHADAQKLLVLVERKFQPSPPPKPTEAKSQPVIGVVSLRHILLPDVPDILPGPFEWCAIPAGRVEIEDGHGWFDVAAFAMAKYLITNAQYQVFVDARNGYANTQWWSYSGEALTWRKENPKSKDTAFAGNDLPRTNVNWYEAVAFCQWLSEQTGEAITLPTEQQWQRAAQGNDGREYPWGDEFDSSRCNTSESGIGKPTAVAQYQSGASPYGVMDMSGNVWEWCLNTYEDPKTGDLSGDASRVVRGGSWGFDRFARCAYRSGRRPGSRFNRYGFRVVSAALYD